MKQKFIKLVLLLCAILLVNANMVGQLVNPYFEDGDKVAFVGNSITRNGEFYAIISLYQATRFPHQKVRFYNCGISGDKASDVLKRYNSDVMELSPNKVSVMLGMNDVGLYNYYETLLVSGSFPPDVVASQQYRNDLYISNMTELVSKFKSSGCQVVIQSPTMLDEKIVPTSSTALAKTVGGNAALGVFTLLCKGWANEPANNFPFVDYYTELNRIDSLEKIINPAFSFTPVDKIHPITLGHFVMAHSYLKALGMPATVSNVEVTVGNINPVKSENATISDISLTADGGTFNVHAKSLPMPIIPGTERALNWGYFDFYNELNSEMLKVNGLNSTQQYGLLIGGVFVANYSGTDFANGINLARDTTPQLLQADNIKKLIYQKSALEWKIRQMRLMERFLTQIEMETMTMEQKMDAVAIQSVETTANKANYALDRPKEAAYRQQITAIENDIFTNQPTKEYVYSITTPIYLVGYNINDWIQLTTFLTQPSTVVGKTNADVLGITNLNDPSTWPNSGTSSSAPTAWVWDTSSPKRLSRINLGNLSDATVKSQLSGDLSFSPASGNLAGLSLSGCSNINSFELTGTSSGPYSTYFDNCNSLVKIDLSNKRSSFTALFVRNCPKLKTLLFNSGAFTLNNTTMQCDVSNNPLLSNITKVDVAVTSTQADKILYPDNFFRIRNNALRFSQLPTISKFCTKRITADTIVFSNNLFILDNLYSYNQLKHEVTMDMIIDLSNEVNVSLYTNVSSNISVFKWFKSNDNTQVYPVEITPGKFKLTGADFSVGESYYVTISNDTYSAFGLHEVKSAPFYINELGAGIEQKEKINLQIYPNPFENSISITSDNEIQKVEIYNIIGKLMTSKIPHKNKLNLFSLPSGSYIIKCFTADGILAQNIIKR
jgi:lysophospholipase L1-like esterase